METIDRASVIVTPKKPFYDWANSLDPQKPISMEELDEKETDTDETCWPGDLSYVLFHGWFDIKTCSMVFDVEEGAISKESALGEE